MFFSQEFWFGVSFGVVGAGGLALLLPSQKHSPTDVREPLYKQENLNDDDDKFFDEESMSCRSVSDAEFRSFRSVSRADSRSFRTMSDADSKSFRSMSDEILNDHNVKSIAELYMDAEDKRTFRDLQDNFKVVEANCLALRRHVADAINTFQQTVDDQRLLIDDLRLEVTRLKKDLNRSTADLLKNSETPSAETNTEKPVGCKIRRLKTRVSVLESDVTKNSTAVVGINRTLMLMLTSAGAAADYVTSAEENLYEQNTQNAQCQNPTSPTTASFTPATGPPPLRPVRKQPSPTPAITSANFGTPPLPPPMTTGTAAFHRDAVQKPCASIRGSEWVELKPYYHVPITEESLRSVVFKPVARQT